MTPKRWRQVKEVMEAAWERDASERGDFLDQACAGDPELRSDVEALLASDENASEFLAVPAMQLGQRPVTEVSAEYWAGRRLGPYQVLREIGHGGMGTVYLAERADGQYRKQVAIKLVSPHLGTEEVLRRFRNERQVEASLDHPNIARLLDGGTTEDGLPYLVMEYVEGMRIDRWCNSRKLPIRDRLKLFRQVCAAVQSAHEREIIHRDLKPGNILVTAEGTPKLLDFGIAKVLNRDLPEAAETTIGPAPMTPDYASPEQVRGDPVGPASDIYALGVVLYELLTGQLPYAVHGSDVRSVARVICEQEPIKPSVAIQRAQDEPGGKGGAGREITSEARSETPTGLRRRLAGDLDNIVLKALRKEPERRYSSVAQLSEDLRRFLQDLPVQARGETLPYRGRKFLKRNRALITAGVAGAVMVLALVAVLGRFTTSNAGTETGVRSIAVLPLENLSGDREQEYFADGITDALISELAQIPELRVISRTSVMTYKGTKQGLPEIARKLGVTTIAEGSVLRSGSRVRIALRLMDAPKERTAWSGSYEGELKDVIALQSRVAEAVAEEIHVTLTAPKQTRNSRPHRLDLGAYDAYLKGQHESRSELSRQSMDKAIAWFQQALMLDPDYAPAYVGLARCYYAVSNLYYPPSEMMPKVKSAALKAIELDPTLGEAYATLAQVRSLYDFNRFEAEKGFRRALELKPSDADAHAWYGTHLLRMGRFDEALAEAERAQKLDPVSPDLNTSVPWAFYFAHRYDQVIEWMQPILEKHPNYNRLHLLPAMAYEQKGEWDKAIAEMEKAVDPNGAEIDDLARLGHVYAVSGRTADARKILGRVMKESHRRYVASFGIALLHAGLGERDEAFRWLQKAYDDHSENFAYINVDPSFDAFHSDPRWAGILRNAGLVQ